VWTACQLHVVQTHTLELQAGSPASGSAKTLLPLALIRPLTISFKSSAASAYFIDPAVRASFGSIMIFLDT